MSWFGQIYQIIVTNMCVLIWKFNSYSVQCDEIWAYSFGTNLVYIWENSLDLETFNSDSRQLDAIFGHIHFIFGTDFVYDLEKYTWFETFNKDSGQCDFDYLETFKTVIAAGSVMPGLEAAPPLLIYYWPQVISPPLPPSSLHQIHLQIWTNMLYILYKYIL